MDQRIGLLAIDLATQTLYVATRSVEAGVTLPRLHAVDLASGQELLNSPVTIQAQVKNLAQQTKIRNWARIERTPPLPNLVTN